MITSQLAKNNESGTHVPSGKETERWNAVDALWLFLSAIFWVILQWFAFVVYMEWEDFDFYYMECRSDLDYDLYSCFMDGGMEYLLIVPIFLASMAFLFFLNPPKRNNPFAIVVQIISLIILVPFGIILFILGIAGMILVFFLILVGIGHLFNIEGSNDKK